MTILILDPSSTCTGYAIMSDRKNARGRYSLMDAGRLMPERAKDPANDRIRAMVREILNISAEHRPDRIVVEDTSGKIARHGRGRGMNGAGLAIYGKAVGWILGACYSTGIEVVPILENEWTRGISKEGRQKIVIAAYGDQYDPAKDPGLDTSDAIRLGEYFLALEDLNHGRSKNQSTENRSHRARV